MRHGPCTATEYGFWGGTGDIFNTDTADLKQSFTENLGTLHALRLTGLTLAMMRH